MASPLNTLKNGVTKLNDLRKREQEEKEDALMEEYFNSHNLPLQRQAELFMRPNGKMMEMSKEKVYIRCKKCGDYVLVDKQFFFSF